MQYFIEQFLKLVPQAEQYNFREGVWYASALYGDPVRGVVVSIECNRRGSIKYALSPPHDEADALLQTSIRGEIVDLYGTGDQIALLVYLAEKCDSGLSVLFFADIEVEAAHATEVYEQLRSGVLDVPTAAQKVANG